MKFKDKILVQTVVTLTLIAMINGNYLVTNEKVLDIKDEIKNQINRNYTIEDIKQAEQQVVSYVLKAPKAINTAITVANEISYFKYPVDESSNEKIINVRAAAGGEVIYAGIHKDIGACVRIKHGEKISTYGNLHTINVITGDRVKKSDIIGTYNNESEEEFYYQLEDNMV